ncbi:endonuclease [Maribellus maritimus]|uniref:endonuclease n=1 Tax=Maribellus maritimus TaxID=2870838 RepID=UPI001EE9F627|nr:endonuclease [Maribellus maritimus]MCG6189125.1 endonuclease [Maribellus maritimus]
MQFKYLSFLFLFFITKLVSAQIPSGYYDSANGLSGEQLKTALYDIIKNHTEYPYTSSSTDVWDILKETDRDTANPENVILFYTGWSINAAQEYNNGNGWSREHVWAKSHGDFGTTMGAGTDAHHLRPADITVNSARNNKDFDNGGSLYIDGDGATECYSDADSWQPRDAVKGDVARMLFYMAIRYEGENGEPDLELVDQVNTFDLNEDGKGYMGKLSTLLAWNIEDPVDSFEIHRNNVVYSFQGNRNPFIDHPEYVNEIWTVTSTHVINEPQIKIYPNPAKDYLNIELFNNNPAKGTVYNLSGEKIISFNITGNYKLSTIGIRSGLYFLHIATEDRVFQFKLVISKLDS